MASLKVEGLEQFSDSITKMAQFENDELLNNMLIAGADKVKKEWIDGITRHNHIDKRIMIAKVGRTKPKKNKYGRICSVYPKGEEKRARGNVRNAAKAFWIHYGSQGRPGDRFVTEIEVKAEPESTAAMEKVLDEFTKRVMGGK